jgi:hypothetical protein
MGAGVLEHESRRSNLCVGFDLDQCGGICGCDAVFRRRRFDAPQQRFTLPRKARQGGLAFRFAQRAQQCRVVMQMLRKHQKSSNESVRQQANELIGLIRKLRWMGMEEEAQKAQTELDRCNVRPADSVLAAPRETD